jgi:aldehyde:ferredoxin oxidoreductase
MPKFLRVNMTDRTAVYEDVPEAYKNLAGRGLTSTIVFDEVPPNCHPLGPNNKVVLAPGITTGTAAPTSSRLSVGAKSPLTGGIKESNVGSVFPYQQARMGLGAIIVEGQPEDGSHWVLKITMEGATFEPADDLMGTGLYEMAPRLYEKYGDKVGFMTVGPAGEHKMAMAGVCFNDSEGRPSRYAGRGGLGAVVGSKGLKAIILDPEGAPGVEIADKELFDTGRKKMIDALMTHDITKPKGALNSYGTAVLINIMNEAGGLPTRNFSSGTFEGAANVAGEALFEGNKERLGKELYNHACSPGCIIRCSNTWHNEDGTEMVSCQEYESIWAFGPNCGIDSLDATGKLIWLANDIGLDTIEAGNAVAVAMEAGLVEFGDVEGAVGLLEEIRKGSPLGHIIGNGAAMVGKTFGVVRVPTVKGQAMPAYEPRAVKGIGITYATSTMGADHTAGYTIAPEILSVGGKADALAKEGKGGLSQAFQATTAFIDTSGHCLFIAFAILDIDTGYQGMIDECNGVLGTNWTADDILEIGKEILRKERTFNERAGLTKADDRLPEFMEYEQLPPHNVTFDVSDDVLDSVYGDL